MILDMLKAILFGIVEGVTEWLPVSSTTHLRLLNLLIPIAAPESFMALFEVVIQLGAILAVVVLYWQRLWLFVKPGRGSGPAGVLRMDAVHLWLMVLIAIVPSALVGIPLDDWIDARLDRWGVIAVMLILYGIAFIVVDRPERSGGIDRAEGIGIRTALLIGLAQTLALIPGTSRSGATIMGGVLAGCARSAAVEFSFFMAIPTMAGASLIKLIKLGGGLTAKECFILAAGLLSAFIVSLFCISSLVSYLKRRSFAIYGWYRIALGLVLFLFMILKKLPA
ncbi:MAG: undecaprenyl-diphosphate phosphatase [Clostridia bacterium]|nr:undecaprenyl-diphosphate phosphatase [Clostridia bacterium]